MPAAAYSALGWSGSPRSTASAPPAFAAFCSTTAPAVLTGAMFSSCLADVAKTVTVPVTSSAASVSEMAVIFFIFMIALILSSIAFLLK